MGQNGRALLLALCAAAGVVGVAGCGSSPLAQAATSLRAAHDAIVVHADGHTSPARPGMTLQRGDEVVTDPTGSATLATLDRVVFVVPRSAVRISNGARQSVQRGSAVVDARAGDGEQVAVDGFTVSVPGGTASRIDGGVTARVATLAGSARVVAPGGAALAVPALSQAMLGGDTLPAATTALRLTDDAAEAAAAPGLVRDDEVLDDLARGLDGSGTAAARSVQTAWRSTAGAASQAVQVAADQSGTAISDRVLPMVLSRAASGPSSADYVAAVRWRAQGGSWGVIAHRLGVTASRAADELTALERQPHGGLARAIAAAVLSGGRPTTTTAGTGTGHSPSGPSNGNGSPPPSSSSPPNPSPTPTPSPTGTLRKLVGGVDRTVRKVLKALPPPLQQPTISASLGPVHVGVG